MGVSGHKVTIGIKGAAFRDRWDRGGLVQFKMSRLLVKRYVGYWSSV